MWEWCQKVQVNNPSSNILPFYIQDLMLVLIPGEEKRHVITQLCTSKSWILSSVIVIKVKIATHYFHWLLSTKNANFKNSIFLMMPTVMQSNDHNRVWASYPSAQGTLSIPKCLSHSRIFNGADVLSSEMTLYHPVVYYVSHVTRNELRC
jgi:hypothetical protein